MDPFTLSWMVWLVIWLAAWLWSKRSRRRESFSTGAWHTLAFVVAFVLISAHHLTPGMLLYPVVPYLRPFYAIGLFLTVAGLVFSVWARLYLGSNWSASVQVKEQHQLVRSGPYHFVRHPIYTGILAAFLGTALAQDQWRSVLAFVVLVAGVIYKLRLEERFMTETFGETYRDYRRHVRALVPFVY